MLEKKALLELDSSAILIGDQVKATLKFELERGEQVKFPNVDKFLTDQLEVTEVSEVDTQLINDLKILSQTLKITSFDSGNLQIPAFKFVLKRKDNSIDTVSSSPIQLRVDLVAVDTLASFKDIKAPIDTPFQRNELWGYINYLLYLVILIIVIMIVVQYLRLNKSKPKPTPPPPVIVEEPAEFIAIKELEALSQKKDWQTIQGVKDFHEDVSVILRRYLQKKFKMIALERTSGEILNELKNKSLDKELYKSLNQILVLSDYVKFAKYNPTREENESSLNSSFLFVNKTKEGNTQGKKDA